MRFNYFDDNNDHFTRHRRSPRRSFDHGTVATAPRAIVATHTRNVNNLNSDPLATLKDNIQAAIGAEYKKQINQQNEKMTKFLKGIVKLQSEHEMTEAEKEELKTADVDRVNEMMNEITHRTTLVSLNHHIKTKQADNIEDCRKQSKDC